MYDRKAMWSSAIGSSVLFSGLSELNVRHPDPQEKEGHAAAGHDEEAGEELALPTAGDKQAQKPDSCQEISDDVDCFPNPFHVIHVLYDKIDFQFFLRTALAVWRKKKRLRRDAVTSFLSYTVGIASAAGTL